MQSLNQMCRTLGDTSTSICAIRPSTHAIVGVPQRSDGQILARLMFPVTGRVIADYNWHLGSFEYCRCLPR